MRSTTARSHWSATRMEADRRMKNSRPPSRTAGLMMWNWQSRMSSAAGISSTEMEMGLTHPRFLANVFMTMVV